MVPKKRQSKRTTTKLRTKVEKKVKEHHRKVRKNAKKSQHKRSQKDPGIPNSIPFKEKLLQDLQSNRRQELSKSLGQSDQEKYSTLSAIASAREVTYSESIPEEEQSIIKDNSKRAFCREFQKVVEIADVLIEVLDARDPLACRDSYVEKLVMEKGKKLVLLLNKIDLVPRENALNWVFFLKNEYPTIPFKASTQTQRSNLGHANLGRENSADGISSECCFGAEDVMNVLKNYSRSHSKKTSITVGVVGLPNVGKSSFINSLKRSKVCQVGSVPGITRSIQEIVLDKNIKLLDSPGIVFGKDGNALLRNTVRIDRLEDVLELVELIMQKSNKPLLRKLYKIPDELDFVNAASFLALAAQTLGKLKKGGILDIEAAGKMVIHDWNSAKIPFYSIPPLIANTLVESSIVSELGMPFQIDSSEMEIN